VGRGSTSTAIERHPKDRHKRSIELRSVDAIHPAACPRRRNGIQSAYACGDNEDIAELTRGHAVGVTRSTLMPTCIYG